MPEKEENLLELLKDFQREKYIWIVNNAAVLRMCVFWRIEFY